MGSAAKSVSGICLEVTNSGLYAILVDTAVSSLPASATNTIASSGSTTGMRLLIRVYGHTATGTISIAGTAPGTLAAVTETSTTLAVQQNPGWAAEYTTSAVYGAINASGITVSGLTGGRVLVYGIQAAKRLLPGEFKVSDKQKEFSPLEQRGTFDRDSFLLPLTIESAGEFTGPLYGDSSTFLYYMGYNSAPTANAIGGTVAVLSSTPIATSGTASAALQPTAPGMILGCVIGGANPTSSQSITITGTNEYGQTISETVVTTKSQGTYYSTNRFASIAASGIAYGAFGTSVTLTITGYLGWQLTSNPGDTLASAAGENYDSTGSFALPWWVLDEWSLEFGMDAEAKISAKGPCQYVTQVGNASTTTNQITAFAQPIDIPVTGWQSMWYVDAQTGTPGTTQWLDVMKGKIAVKLAQKFRYTSWGNPPYRVANRAYRNRREVEIELEVDETGTTFNNEYTAWEENRYRYVQLQLRGNLLAQVAGTNYYLGPTFTFPVKWVDEPARDFAPGQDAPVIKLKGKARYDPVLGYSHKLVWNTAFPTW